MLQRGLNQLILSVRQLSMTENDQSITDNEITDRLSEALSSLDDIITGEYEHYRVTSVDFTLAGGVGGNTFPLPADFYKDIGLNRNPTDSQPETVHAFNSWIERNILPRREYTLLGDNLVVSPIALAQGVYRLYYQPLVTSFYNGVLALDSTDSFTTISVGVGKYTFPQLTFPPDNLATGANIWIGGSVTITGSATAGGDGTFAITDVISAHVLQVARTTQTISETFTAAASAVVIPANTAYNVPQIYLPWYEYLQVHAACAVKDKLEQDTSTLEARREALKERIHAMAANRQEEGGQVAIVRNGTRTLTGPGFDDGWPW
jgi:hypothetical protein